MKANEEKTIDGVKVTNKGADIPDEEVMEYIIRGRKKHSMLFAMTVEIVGDDVELNYFTKPIPFDRIRRITGYLVGTLDRFNDAKRSEEHDRVKHNI